MTTTSSHVWSFFDEILFAQWAKIWQNSYYSMVCKMHNVKWNFRIRCIMELIFKWLYHSSFLVSNQSSDDDDLLTRVVFFWRNSFCAMSQNLTNSYYSMVCKMRNVKWNFRIRWIMELIFKWLYHSSFLSAHGSPGRF